MARPPAVPVPPNGLDRAHLAVLEVYDALRVTIFTTVPTSTQPFSRTDPDDAFPPDRTSAGRPRTVPRPRAVARPVRAAGPDPPYVSIKDARSRNAPPG